MKKEEIIKQLHYHHQQFINVINNLPEGSFMLSVNNKWAAGQQLDHIRRSLKPLALGFSLPVFMLRLIFGKANRPSKTYDELVAKYQKRLTQRYNIGPRFTPKAVPFQLKQKLIGQIEKYVNKSLPNKLKKLSEEQLDTLIIPHPLIGKLTLREMMYFTIYHVQHHHKQVLNIN